MAKQRVLFIPRHQRKGIGFSFRQFWVPALIKLLFYICIITGYFFLLLKMFSCISISSKSCSLLKQ